MNPLLMNADDLVRWYKPQTEMEKHLLSVIAEQKQDLNDEIDPQIVYLENQIAKLESSADEKDDTILNLRTEIERLEILVDDLGSKLDALEGSIP